MQFTVHKYGAVTSTQLILQKINNAGEGCVACADFQTHGRGQQGALWESEAGQNLLCSLLVEPSEMTAQHLFDLSRATALSIAHFLRQQGINAEIKWSNDIFAGERKIAGVIIEPSIRNNIVQKALIGIGLNVNQTVFTAAPRAVSMKMILHKTLDVAECRDGMLACFAAQYGILQKRQYEILRSAYHNLLYRREGLHAYCACGETFRASLLQVSNGGDLVLQKKNGTTASYRFKEIEFIY